VFVLAGAAPDTLFLKDSLMRDLKWSPSEKIVARRAFDQALQTEWRDLIREAKGRAATVEGVSELWQLESWLTERRREMERQYDYRYSVLPFVFATLLKQGRLSESDLHGLAVEKVELIRSIASRLGN
jgi:Photoprotection regulator fluorescence recovery protein